MCQEATTAFVPGLQQCPLSAECAPSVLSVTSAEKTTSQKKKYKQRRLLAWTRKQAALKRLIEEATDWTDEPMRLDNKKPSFRVSRIRMPTNEESAHQIDEGEGEEGFEREREK